MMVRANGTFNYGPIDGSSSPTGFSPVLSPPLTPGLLYNYEFQFQGTNEIVLFLTNTAGNPTYSYNTLTIFDYPSSGTINQVYYAPSAPTIGFKLLAY